MRPEEFRGAVMPSVSDYPTSRLVLVEDEAGTAVAMACAVLPAPDARFGFEVGAPLPQPALPTSERTQLGEGLWLYVAPAHRRSGVAHALTFLTMLLAWEAGAHYIVAENGAVSLKMALAAGFTNTGVLTKHRAEVPYYLTVGPARTVLEAGWTGAREALEACTLSPEVRALIDRWVASLESARGS